MNSLFQKMQPPAKKQRACGLFSCEDPSAGALSTSFQGNDGFGYYDHDTPYVPGSLRRKPAGCMTARLESCERLFGSQTLASPSDAKHNSGCLTIAEDFVIHCSQSYMRAATQPPAEVESLLVQEEDDDMLMSPQHSAPAALATGPLNVQGNPARSSTPELAVEVAKNHGEKKYFTIFRPVQSRKRLIIIRHGESEYNAAIKGPASSMADPRIFDPRLTAKGRFQARNLQAELKTLNLPSSTLWVGSPLTRTIETLLLSCPRADEIGRPEQPGFKPPRVVIRRQDTGMMCSEISEHVMTTGDVGRRASVLVHDFPQLAGELQKLPEKWWFKPEKNDSDLQRHESTESKADVKRRVGQFNAWLSRQPEKIVVAYGHSIFWRDFMLTHAARREKLRNCEYFEMLV